VTHLLLAAVAAVVALELWLKAEEQGLLRPPVPPGKAVPPKKGGTSPPAARPAQLATGA
jgi:hypothetical protein